jgi:hypothetical protein
VTEIAPPEAFGDVQLVAVRMTEAVERRLGVEAGGLDDEGVAIPAPTE